MVHGRQWIAFEMIEFLIFFIQPTMYMKNTHFDFPMSNIKITITSTFHTEKNKRIVCFLLICLAFVLVQRERSNLWSTYLLMILVGNMPTRWFHLLFYNCFALDLIDYNNIICQWFKAYAAFFVERRKITITTLCVNWK